MTRRAILVAFLLFACVGIVWAQDVNTATDNTNSSSQETITIPKSEFDELKDSVAQMREELDQLKQNQSPSKPASTAPSAPEVSDKNADQPAEEPAEPSAEQQAEQPSTTEAPSGGKQLLLPDISLVGQAKGLLSSDQNDNRRDTLRLSELELAVQGYVYPNVKADAFLTASPQEHTPFSVEEAYLTYLGLGKGLNLYVGEKHVPFGRTNLQHSHSWLYVNQPEVLQNLVAEESLAGEGVDVSYLIPTNSNLFAQLDLGTWTIQGQDTQEATNLPDVVTGPGAAFNNHFNTARLWTGYPITENSELELGGSYAGGAAYGQAIPGYGQAQLSGVDLSYRHFGEANQRLLLRGENIWRHEYAGPAENTVSGYYLLGDYRWDKYHSIGMLYDWSQFPQLAAEGQHESAFSLIFTRQFSEQYYIRLQATHGARPDSHSYNELWLQWVWGVGPHTHNLE